ncbi:hypothetical protein AB0B11_28435, partial [Micromonospora tulbaghiae]|uniref:hypothetical protein n=1 Tax=Micromonospora tulbaghiae TaxID=479978 RepID=UPI0033F2E861
FATAAVSTAIVDPSDIRCCSLIRSYTVRFTVPAAVTVAVGSSGDSPLTILAMMESGFWAVGLLVCAGLSCLFLVVAVGLLAAWWKPKD